MFKKISIFAFILLLSVSYTFAGGKWILQKSFNVDTSAAFGVGYLWLAADTADNIYASGYNTNAVDGIIHFYKISDWISGTPTFLAFDNITGIVNNRGGLGIDVDSDGNIYGAVETGSAPSSFYRIWNSSLAEVTTVYNPSSGRPTGVAVDNDVTNPKGRHLFHGDLLNGKIRGRNMLDQSFTGVTPWNQLLPGSYPRDIVLQPNAGTDSVYSIWVNRERTILRFANVSGRDIENDVTSSIHYAADTVVNNVTQTTSGLGIAYDSVKNTIIYSGGSATGNGIAHTIQIIKADTTGTVVQVLGTPDTPGNDDTHFTFPTDAVVVTSGAKRYLAVSDYSNWRIVVYRYDITVTPQVPQLINPGQSVIVSADTTVTNGTITWSMSTPGLGQLSAPTGPSVTFTADTGNILGSLTITATDADGDTGTTALITITPTTAPIISDVRAPNRTEQVGVIKQ